MHTRCKGIIIVGINIVIIMEREFNIKEPNNTWQSQRLFSCNGAGGNAGKSQHGNGERSDFFHVDNPLLSILNGIRVAFIR